jgi:hypothetical protein
LKHENFLFRAAAGPYAKVDDALPLLADRIEGLIFPGTCQMDLSTAAVSEIWREAYAPED